ncbi:uncharacterized protein RCC_01811 [Ramularia collo-cygni]|uniref:F-box domain-containing protein n=1 Tax=Ramularia collo-cygni TaxID=112498 RepID=A0A2D3UN13_9PEZI|nr:uncharacterized protein RCC_01811 [Ramularia collo-cygni]CZT15971.1 uncharacterized protein RCC_01811 [Ramularia collo-cygni]
MSSPPEPSGTAGTFRLFDLPREILLHIIDLAVVQSEPIVIRIIYYPDNRSLTSSQRAYRALMTGENQPAISKTCRALRKDAIKAFYRLNEFQADHCTHSDHEYWPVFRDWLDRIGANRRYLRNLRTRDWMSYNYGPVGGSDGCLERCRSKLGAKGAVITKVEGEDYTWMVCFPEVTD